MVDDPVSLMAGVEMIDVEHFETPAGGKVFIGHCAGDPDHIVLFAHITEEDVPALVTALQEAQLRHMKEKGNA